MSKNDSYQEFNEKIQSEKSRLEALKRTDLLNRIDDLQQEIKLEEFESIAIGRMRQLVLTIKKKIGR